jgi:hypothetical protein
MHLVWRTREGKKATSQYCHIAESKRVGGKVKTQVVAYIGSVYLNPSKPEREVFWMQVKNHLDELSLTTAHRAKIEAAIAQKVPRGKNPDGDSDAPVEWYTPPIYIEMARRVLGGIDLDPASNEVAQAWIQAAKYFTVVEDGLKQSWQGRVWCNPPYGRDVKRWLAKAITSYQSGDVDAAIVLLNRSGASWYRELRKKVAAVCEVDKRIAFLDATGFPQGSPRYNNDFLYLGQNVELFQEVFKPLGEVRLYA